MFSDEARVCLRLAASERSDQRLQALQCIESVERLLLAQHSAQVPLCAALCRCHNRQRAVLRSARSAMLEAQRNASTARCALCVCVARDALRFERFSVAGAKAGAASSRSHVLRLRWPSGARGSRVRSGAQSGARQRMQRQASEQASERTSERANE